MANQTWNLKNSRLTIMDNTPTTPLEVVIPLLDGNLSLSIPGEPYVEVRDQGEIDHIRPGDPGLLSGSAGFKFKGFTTGATGVTPAEALMGDGASWVYTAVTGAGYDLADATTVKVLQLLFEILDDSGSLVESVEIPNVPCPTIDFREGKEANAISFSFTAIQRKPIFATS